MEPGMELCKKLFDLATRRSGGTPELVRDMTTLARAYDEKWARELALHKQHAETVQRGAEHSVARLLERIAELELRLKAAEGATHG